jgi:putative ABC transport system permease protein
MFKNYLRIAIRQFTKQKLFTCLNVFGLAIGLALCMVVVGHISHEVTFENIHQNRNRIFRVNGDYISGEKENYSAKVMAPLGPAIVDEVPEIDKAAIFRIWDIESLKIGDERFKVTDPNETAAWTYHKTMMFANPDILDVFTLPLKQGNPRTALHEPFTMFVTEKAALEYFQNPNPVGETVKINDKFECQVVGILKDIPQKTQIYSDFLISYSTLEKIDVDINSWDHFGTDYVYLLLNENADPLAIESKLPYVLKNHMESEQAEKYAFSLQPLKDIYFSALYSGRSSELNPLGVVEDIMFPAFIALFVLLQAIANFINLSTARSSERMREVGVRKVFGAFRGNLIRQFIGESVIIASVAMILSVGMYEVFKLMVNHRLPREMLDDFYRSPLMLIAFVGLIVVVGVIAGFYPAFYLSRFRPVSVLQGKGSIKSTKSWLRRILVVVQFGLAILFIVCSITLYRQTSYIASVNLGFDRENMLVIDFNGEDRTNDCQLMKHEVLKLKNVISATTTDHPLGRKSNTWYSFYKNENRLDEDRYFPMLTHSDYDFVSTFGLEIVQGRDFSPETPTDEGNAIIVNEATLRKLEIEHPIGYKLYTKNKEFEIIGVVQDYHGTQLDWGYRSLSFIRYYPERLETLVVKLASEDVAGTIAAIEKTWKTTLPGQQFEYNFLDEEISSNYSEYRTQSTISLAITLMSVLIACLGIFGLVSFTTARRTKEIGIRKVLGCNVTGILTLLSKEYIILIAIANVIAWPFAYMLLQSFLQEFAFQISIGVGTFLIAGLSAITIALATSSFQSYKAATANPVDALRYE